MWKYRLSQAFVGPRSQLEGLYCSAPLLRPLLDSLWEGLLFRRTIGLENFLGNKFCLANNLPNRGVHLISGSLSFGISLHFCLFCFYRESYRNVGLLWVGSFVNSILVFLPGCLSGEWPLHRITSASNYEVFQCLLWSISDWSKSSWNEIILMSVHDTCTCVYLCAKKSVKIVLKL